jgi:hypothetical protein
MLDPPLAPPRMMRDDTNCSVPWDHDTQSFMSRERARHVNNVKQRFNNRRPSSVSARPSQQSNQAQPGPRPQSNVNSVPSIQRPAVPNLISRGNLNAISTSSVQVNVSQPQPNLAQGGPPPPPAQPRVGLPQGGPLPGQAQPGVALPPPPPAQAPRFVCEAGGTNHLLARTLIDDIDNVPEITLNLPRTPFGSQAARNYSDQRNLYHNNDDLVWDYASNIHLTNDIHHHRPNIAPPNSGNPFMTPPLASSTKYPNLPINFYGSDIQSLPRSINQQNQQNNVSLAQLTVTPQPNISGVTGSQIGVTATVTSVTTPILSSSTVAPVVNVPVTKATGTKPKQILSPPPPPPPPILPISDPIQTRSLTGHSRPAPGFMQNVKSTLNKVKDKQGKGGTSRSSSK